MRVVERVTDKQVVKNFKELVHAKLHEAQHFPDAVQGWHCSAGHDIASFVLDCGPLAAKVAHDSAGHHRMSFSAFEYEDRLPAYELYLTEDQALVAEFGSDEATVPAVSEMLAQAETMPVGLNELVPYGWVENNAITMVMFSGEYDIMEMSGVEINASGLDAFVLEGHKMPAELKMDVDRYPEWIAAVWEQIKAGRLVRLTDRINSLEDKVFARGDGTDMGSIEFDETDGRVPAFVVGKPYGYWHPRENFPGEVMQGWQDEEGQEPYERLLAGWFR